ncbi:MAG: hypothetical protein MI975_13510 [Cytophagales bacterium]|nr:hypothetical protein [Cytophagales bacterium]
MKTPEIVKKSSVFFPALFIIPFLLAAQQRNGKLLRGEVWQKFEAPKEADFYVAVNGNDNWSGTLPNPNNENTDGPFATVKRAQRAVRALKSNVYFPKEDPVEKRWIGSPHPLGRGKDILVLIRGGFYSLDEPLHFMPQDGGERIETNLPTGAFEYHKLRDHYVTYAAYPGEEPVISGGVLLNAWKKGKKLWTSKVSGTNVAMLVANVKKQVLARTPNEGYFIPPAISESTDELFFNPGELKSWKNMGDNRVHMLLRWHHGANSFKSIDEKKGVAKLVTPQDGVVIVPPRYFVENVSALMDAPGEWYFNKKNGELNYIPPSEIRSSGSVLLSAPQLDQLVIVKGARGKPVRNLRFYGLTFEGTLPGKSAIAFTYAHMNEFVGNKLRAAAGTGITLAEGCYQTKILENRMDGIDRRAIVVRGPEDPASGRDILRETLISYNHISNCGGVNIDAAFSVFTTISHNYITKTRGRYAISVGGWHNLEEAIDGAYVVEYNHLDDVQKDADDSGAIKTAGTTFNSVVRKNLVHDVRAGFFNDNVGFWFDNMSLGWVAEDNIFYNLEQGEMKLCAANLVDNLYQNNFVIDAPANAPETFIGGEPEFAYSDLDILPSETDDAGNISSGSNIKIRVVVTNTGSTGIAPVRLYLDGKVFKEKDVPAIHGNSVKVDFDVRLYDAGAHHLAIGTTDYREVAVKGTRPAVVFDRLELSDARIIQGEQVAVLAHARNLTGSNQVTEAVLYFDKEVVASKPVELGPGQSGVVEFSEIPDVGEYKVRVGNSEVFHLKVQDYELLDLSSLELFEHCSAKAKPYEIRADQKQNRYRVKAGGSDFFHAEDSYAAIFTRKLKGDFVATVKIRQFGARTHEWFRAGLFARNDMTQSFDTRPGSKGSFLVFGTPGRAGINYDEFANGCMHKASSQNLPEQVDFPYWLKLERHGDYFVGSISLDGKNWINEKRSGDIPGLDEEIDLGLAAGSCDKIPYWVEFEDWKIKVAR